MKADISKPHGPAAGMSDGFRHPQVYSDNPTIGAYPRRPRYEWKVVHCQDVPFHTIHGATRFRGQRALEIIKELRLDQAQIHIHIMEQ